MLPHAVRRREDLQSSSRSCRVYRSVSWSFCPVLTRNLLITNEVSYHCDDRSVAECGRFKRHTVSGTMGLANPDRSPSVSTLQMVAESGCCRRAYLFRHQSASNGCREPSRFTFQTGGERSARYPYRVRYPRCSKPRQSPDCFTLQTGGWVAHSKPTPSTGANRFPSGAGHLTDYPSEVVRKVGLEPTISPRSERGGFTNLSTRALTGVTRRT